MSIWHDSGVTVADSQARASLLRRGFLLEYVTQTWNVVGIVWTAVTAAAMFALAAGKARTGRALDNPVLLTEGRVTAVDGILAVAVLLGLTLNAAAGWWWADPAAGYVLVFYAAREVREVFFARS
jgi:divalent metal cation (Fe/Co/Zn/Cd) transporter